MSQMRTSSAPRPPLGERETKTPFTLRRRQRIPPPPEPSSHPHCPRRPVSGNSPEASGASERDKLVMEHLSTVEVIARQMARHMPPLVELDDLIGTGTIGLIRAAQDYKPIFGVRFRTYADHRIRGAIYDGLRHWDLEPRLKRRTIKWLGKMRAEAEQQFCRAPSDAAMMEFLGMDGETFYKLLRDNSPLAFTTLEAAQEDQDMSWSGALSDVIPDPNLMPADERIQVEQLYEMVADAIDQLPEKDRIVLALYYFEELVMREIAEVLGVTESRVSQVHKKALSKLRKQLNAALKCPEELIRSQSSKRGLRCNQSSLNSTIEAPIHQAIG